MDDDTAGVYHWNYHLANSTVNYANPGNPEHGIGLLRIQTAPDSVDVSTLGSTSGWSVYVGDASDNNGIVQWTAGAGTAQILPGDSADFWFDTDPVDLVVGTTEFTNAGVVLPGVFLTQAPGAPAPVDYDAIYNKLVYLLLNRPPTLQANIPGQDPDIGVLWRVWSANFVAELSKIRDPRADLRLYSLLDRIADNGVAQAINDEVARAGGTPLGLFPGVDAVVPITNAFQAISTKVQSILTNQLLSDLPTRIIGQNGLVAWWLAEIAKPSKDYTNVLPGLIDQLKSADYTDRAAAAQSLKDDLLRYAVVGRRQDFDDLMCMLVAARGNLQGELADAAANEDMPTYIRVNEAIRVLNQVIEYGNRSLYLYVTRPQRTDPGLPRLIGE